MINKLNINNLLMNLIQINLKKYKIQKININVKVKKTIRFMLLNIINLNKIINQQNNVKK